MEQKGLDEIEESFLGEEIIEDEVSVMTEAKITKPAAKKKTTKVKGNKVSSNAKEVVEKSEPKKAAEPKVEVIPITPKKEEVIITPTVVKKTTKKEDVAKPTVTPIDTKSKNVADIKSKPAIKETPKTETWGKDPMAPSGSNAWAILSGVLVVLLLLSVFTQGFSFGADGSSSADSISLSEAEEIVQDYVNTYLLPAPYTAGLIDSEDVGDLYRVTLSVSGQEIDSYITKDGDLFFPQGLELEDTEEESEEEVEYEEVDRVDVSIDDDAYKGDWDAPVTIVEFSDYECPFCGKFYEETLPYIDENYIDTGLVRLVFRDLTLSIHEEAEPAAIAAECAGEQGNYFGMHNDLFENQDDLGEELYLELARNLGLDIDEFSECLEDEDGEMAAEIAADAADGESYGVSGTPAFFVNGELISGAQSYEVFEEAIERALAELAEEETTDEEAEVAADDTEEVVEEEEAETVEEEETLSGETVLVEITAKKWRFDPSEVSISAGDTVELTITPEDMDEFTFSIADLGVEETISGETLISFTVSEAGSYEYSCSSCEDWRGMTGELIVE